MRSNFFRTLIILCLSIILAPAQAQDASDIVPKPQQVIQLKQKPVEVDHETVIYYDSPYAVQASYLKDLLQAQTGLALRVQPLQKGKKQKDAIILQHAPEAANKKEMYVLESGNGTVSIKAQDVNGIVYGIQTLLQLVPLENEKDFKVDAVKILDYPTFAYRGMHLDVVRHFFPLEFVKKYIDYLAFHKFNNFHWHLTDDQGWRIEIKSYPKLNSISSWRDSTLIGHFKSEPARYDPTRYGGYYTQDDVKEVIQYAKVRGINIIPEIDIPGHSRATIAAYPEFSTHPDTTWNVAYTWGMYNRQNNVLAPRPETFEFLKTVFGEVADLFPSPYIHIGGDETSKLWWKASPQAQEFIKKHNLKDEKGLQTYFIEQVSDYLKAKNKKVIGWHEILEGDLDTSAVVMNWADDKNGAAAAMRKHPVIMTPGKPLYFDHYQSQNPNDSLAIHGYNPLDAVYNYNPMPTALRGKPEARFILGAQGNVWTEYMGSPAKVEYMVFPRMTALSEVLWSNPQNKNYQDFLRRLEETVIPRYKRWGATYFKDYRDWTIDKARQ
ncbi:beta-N-acetylhexosaminidase [Pontibacter cellulosilyticus]|uniref:beta-N-acetylhexosaminidase n=1 Tax=Pontibacter cellulosilyticus TaxID=1720253 RepID=A0A923N5E4_9BACT|nr:beta-N-acetylhexosaminidase [Pontibacter cellulosilyticus]MBC5992067.1 beta-N-acetylhexosaminidase [Pontibacter cellulosilyticus]